MIVEPPGAPTASLGFPFFSTSVGVIELSGGPVSFCKKWGRPDLPDGLVVDPFGVLVVVSFNPLAPGDVGIPSGAERLAAFRAAAARGRPEVDESVGQDVQLRYRGQRYDLRVGQIATNRYRIASGDAVVTAVLPRLAQLLPRPRA